MGVRYAHFVVLSHIAKLADSGSSLIAVKGGKMKRFLLFALTSMAFAAGTVVPSAPQKGADGCYAISTAEELYGFANIVNASATHDECGKLTKDIVVNDFSKTPVDTIHWTPIDIFRGVFDGQNHSIAGLYASGNGSYVGLFGGVSGLVKLNSSGNYELVQNAAIKNLRLIKAIFYGYDCIGELAGSASNVDITNVSVDGVASAELRAGGLIGCTSTAKISGSSNRGFVGGRTKAGGLVGDFQHDFYYENSSNELIIENSYNTGSVSCNNVPGALVGDVNGNLSVFNSFSTGEVYLSRTTLALVGHTFDPIKSDNYFYIKGRERDTSGIETSLSDFMDGTIAQRLRDYNKNGVDGSVWGQKLGVDSVPRLTGILSVESPKASIVAKTPSVVQGCYQIGSAEELYGFAFIANASLYRDTPVCGKLTKDIVVNKDVLKNDTLNGDGSNFIPWISIKNFAGNFDGSGHVISGVFSKDTNHVGAGLFVSVKNPDASKELKIENVGIEDSYFYSFNGAAALINTIESESGAVTIKNCYSTSYVLGGGGLVGDAKGTLLTIENTYNAGIVDVFEPNSRTAGLVNTAQGDVSIVNSYSVAELKSEYAGTLIGSVFDKATIVNSYGFDSYAKKKSEQSKPIIYVLGDNIEIFNVFSEKSDRTIFGTDKGYPISYVTAEQFADGSVATLLHNYSAQGVNGSIWGQKVGVETTPVFSGVVSTDLTTSDLKLVTYSGDTVKYSDKYIEGIATTLPSPVRKDYTFAGWYKNADFSGEQVKSIPASATGTQTFYAKWWHNPQLVNGCYEIDDDGALYMFVAYVDSLMRSIDKPTLCAKLTADIVVNKNVLVNGKLDSSRADSFKPWIPFGSYNGVFDGAGHTISGLYSTGYHCRNYHDQACGLFGRLEYSNLVIKNLGIVDSYFSGGDNVGGFVGDMYGYSLVIANSYFDGVLIGIENVGGLVGFVGNANTAVLSSYNRGFIDGDYDVGGLVGLSDDGGSLTVMYSSNEGTVKAIQAVGGLVGQDITDFLHISNSYNVGTVTSKKSVNGGLVGDFSDNSAFVYNSYNLGAVAGTDSLGGIYGLKRKYVDLRMDSAYYLKSLPANGGAVAVVAEDFANKNLLNRLQSYKNHGLDGSAWTQADSDKYPVLNKRVSDKFIDSIMVAINVPRSSNSTESSSSVAMSSSSNAGIASSSSTSRNDVNSSSSTTVTSSSSVVKSSSSSQNVILSSSEGSSSSSSWIASSSSRNESSSSVAPKSSSSAIPKSSSSSREKSSSSISVKSSSSGKNSLIASRMISPVIIRSENRRVEISGLHVGESFALMDMQGRLLQRGYANGATAMLRVAQPGRYVVQVSGQVQTVNVH